MLEGKALGAAPGFTPHAAAVNVWFLHGLGFAASGLGFIGGGCQSYDPLLVASAFTNIAPPTVLVLKRRTIILSALGSQTSYAKCLHHLQLYFIGSGCSTLGHRSSFLGKVHRSAAYADWG